MITFRSSRISRTGIQSGTLIQPVPPRVKFRLVSEHSGQFWPVSDFPSKKKRKKQQTHQSQVSSTSPACHLPEFTQRPSPLFFIFFFFSVLHPLVSGTGLLFFYFLLSCLLSVSGSSRVKSCPLLLISNFNFSEPITWLTLEMTEKVKKKNPNASVSQRFFFFPHCVWLFITLY